MKEIKKISLHERVMFKGVMTSAISSEQGVTMMLTEHGVEAEWAEKGDKRSVLVPDDNIALVEFKSDKELKAEADAKAAKAKAEADAKAAKK